MTKLTYNFISSTCRKVTYFLGDERSILLSYKDLFDSGQSMSDGFETPPKLIFLPALCIL